MRQGDKPNENLIGVGCAKADALIPLSPGGCAQCHILSVTPALHSGGIKCWGGRVPCLMLYFAAVSE